MDIKLIASGARPWQYRIGYWGLSYLIDDTILYDTFSNYLVLSYKLFRAKSNPSKIQAVVLSHEHSDHIGGLWSLLEKRRGITVYLPSAVKETVKQRVTSTGGHLIDNLGVKPLKENVWLLNELVGTHKGRPVAEQSIVLKTQKGLVLMVGCSHPGIVNIVQNVKKTFGEPVYGIMGGLHLMHSPEEEICACANALKNEDVKMVAPTHCTGVQGEETFRRFFGKGFVHLREGQKLSL